MRPLISRTAVGKRTTTSWEKDDDAAAAIIVWVEDIY